jgi:phage-related holin
METAAKHIETLYNKAKEYTETSVELYKLNAIEKTANVVSSLTSRMALVLVVSIFTLFVNIALSLFIGEQLNSNYLGFLIVSLFYLITAILIYFFKDKYIEVPISNIVISKLLQQRINKNEKENLEEDEAK